MAGSKQGETKADADFAAMRLAARLGVAASEPGPAPVERWNPPDCGPIDIRIDRDGNWHHEGRPILRKSLAKLFARVLRREADGRYVLVTPVEMLAITVDDVPFVGLELLEDRRPVGVNLFVATNLDEVVPLDAAHPLRVETDAHDGFVPYVTIRPGLEARLSRAAALDLAERADLWHGKLVVVSHGRWISLGRLVPALR